MYKIQPIIQTVETMLATETMAGETEIGTIGTTGEETTKIEIGEYMTEKTDENQEREMGTGTEIRNLVTERKCEKRDFKTSVPLLQKLKGMEVRDWVDFSLSLTSFQEIGICSLLTGSYRFCTSTTSGVRDARRR